jgi:hypothetical protein
MGKKIIEIFENDPTFPQQKQKWPYKSAKKLLQYTKNS